MNKTQSAQLNSFQESEMILEGGTNIWQGSLKYSSNVAEFLAMIVLLIKYKIIQVTDLGGAKAYKQQQRNVMADKAFKIRSAVQNFASDTNNSLLYKQVNISDSKLLYKNEQLSATYALAIEKHARDNAASLIPYHVTDADLDDFKAAITAFMDSSSSAAELRSQRKNATAQLRVLFPQTRAIVETKLRKGAVQFMETAPDFYNTLIDSFEVKNFPTHFTEFDLFISDQATHQALNGVKVTAVSPKGEMVQYSNPTGEVDFIQFESGYWDLTIECPGYEKLEKKNVKADLGKKLDLNFELVKIPV